MIRGSLFREGSELALARVETQGVVRTCLACVRDFAISPDDDPDTVFFCDECSRPPGPNDELGVGG